MDGAFPNELLVGLTPEQREAVTSPARRLLVRATAGSGKTHVLTLRIQRRVASGEIAGEHVLAMTFTRKAGEELRRRLFRSGVRDVRAGTFHRAALTLVNQHRHDTGRSPAQVEANRRRLVAGLVEQLERDGVTRVADWQLPRIEQEIGWALSQGLTGRTYGAEARRHRRDAPLPPTVFAEVLDRYVGLCASRGVLDFDLLLREAIDVLREDAAARAAFRHRTRALFVDEAQDMNPLQFALLREMAGDDPDLFAVGDPHQSIYGFNGASPQLIDEIVRTWPDTQIVDLTRNHRSTAHIVAVANTMLEEGARGITPAREGGAIPLVREYRTDAEEARHVAAWLTATHQPGTAWRSMAVLARTNAQLDVVATALDAADVPYERRGPEHSPASDLTGSETGRRLDGGPAPDAVALSTIHRAKGLEFAHVAVVGWSEGLLPHYAAVRPAQLAEEQRLAYVALSRAESTLLITWSRGRDDARDPDREPSRFLAPITAAIATLAAREAPLTGEARRARLDAIRRQLEQSAQ